MIEATPFTDGGYRSILLILITIFGQHEAFQWYITSVKHQKLVVSADLGHCRFQILQTKRRCKMRLTLLILVALYAQCNAAPSPSNAVCFTVSADEFKKCANPNEDEKRNCLKETVWKYSPEIALSSDDVELLKKVGRDSYIKSADAQERRVRKEYRLLSTEERQRFHASLLHMYQTGSIHAFSHLHATALVAHHKGPSFLPWHRVLLSMFEDALRSYDKSVSLPYWDQTLDYNMEFPVNSIVWSDDYFGNGAGSVTSGFAAGWISAETNILERAYGMENSLMSPDDIANILKVCNLKDISRPWAIGTSSDYEGFHNGVHAWVGGDMAFLKTTAFDPVFYMHHAFIDYIWEKFRGNQRTKCNVDPTEDYPQINNQDIHSATTRMTGFPWFENIDGAHQKWINEYYPYEPTATYPDCCPGCSAPAPIVADNERKLCVSASRFPGSGKRDADAKEKALLSFGLPPTNRGQKFIGPKNDARTLRASVNDF